MRWKAFFITALITAALIFFLDNRWGSLPAFGRLLDPREGFWTNAEPVNRDFSGSFRLASLQQPVKVWLDDRLVPHIFAANEHDLYFMQGYITAKFRLWQMETQTRAAAGRLSEVLGERTLAFDRRQRRKGMVSAAEGSLAAMENDPATKRTLAAYTAGINAYIATLDAKSLPLEYKLLGYRPEPWTPLKCALLLKYMSDDLTGDVDDLENTNALKFFSKADFDRLFPRWPDQADPIIPAGSVYPQSSVPPPVPPADSQWMLQTAGMPVAVDKPDPDNGSNNWAVGGQKTKSGAPILCNDPHLGLNLPSLWYEVQLHTPQMNVYGASLPGAPGVIIGFTDSIAWGVTNAGRDVKDYYSIRFKDDSRRQYRFNGQWRNADLHVETIKVRGGKTFYDTVAYTVFGPVLFDRTYPDTITGHPSLAVHWKAAEASNELRTFYLLNHADNYADFQQALTYYECPAQNFAFASRSGDIAIWQQGKFPLEWQDQGRFIMPGQDSSFLWQGSIPFAENPHILNPVRGFVSSANQQPTDPTYPYYYGGSFAAYRGHRINTVLEAEQHITVRDMMKLQTDTYNSFAADALPLLFHFLQTSALDGDAKKYLGILRQWDLFNHASAAAPVIFDAWWQHLYGGIWTDELTNTTHLPLPQPGDRTTVELLRRDSTAKFIDDHRTRQTETLSMLVTDAFKKAAEEARGTEERGALAWGKYRGTDIMHLARLPAFSREHLYTGGGKYAVNAIKQDHGPSWRMIVQLSDPTEAFGIYPGGQSGNPGSRYYDNFINDWVAGRYYPLHIFTVKDSLDRHVRYRLTFSK